MEKRNKIRDWEAKRDDLNDKLGLCEEKLLHLKQDQRPDGVANEELLAAAKVGVNCFTEILLEEKYFHFQTCKSIYSIQFILSSNPIATKRFMRSFVS